MTEPGAVALRTALRQVAPGRMWPIRNLTEVSNDEFAGRLLAALSPADKLAIAGITEERLGRAIVEHRVLLWGTEPCDAKCARAILAALSETEP